MTDTKLGVGEFVSHILDLAATDSARAWLTLAFDLTDDEIADVPASGDLVTACHHGLGHVDTGRVSGRWPGVVGARYADWLVLPVHGTSVHRLLISRQDVTVEPSDGYAGLGGAGIADITVSELAVDRAHVLGPAPPDGAVLAAAGAAAAVVGSADGLWHRYVERLRAQLASSSDAITDAEAAQLACAESDIDAARLQITDLLTPGDVDAAVSTCRQVVARARAAADQLLEHSRHALDASHPVTLRWREVDLGSRLAVRVLDGLSPQLG